MSYELILMDADDTLFDYSAAEAFALSSTFRKHGLSCDADVVDSYRSINQQLWNEFEQGLVTLASLRVERFKRLWERNNVSVSVQPDVFSATYLEHLAEGTFLMDGAVELCSELLAQG